MGSDAKKSGFFGGFFIGGIVGMIAAIMVTQKENKDKFKNLITKGKETLKEAIAEGREAAARKEAEFHDDSGNSD